MLDQCGVDENKLSHGGVGQPTMDLLQSRVPPASPAHILDCADIHARPVAQSLPNGCNVCPRKFRFAAPALRYGPCVLKALSPLLSKPAENARLDVVARGTPSKLEGKPLPKRLFTMRCDIVVA